MSAKPAGHKPANPLSERLQKQAADVSYTERSQYADAMTVIVSTIPADTHVRWVGKDNKTQIMRHRQLGYDFVRVTDEIETIAQQYSTGMTTEYVEVGDCVLMACLKSEYNRRRKEAELEAQRRMTAIKSGQEYLNDVGKTVGKKGEFSLIAQLSEEEMEESDLDKDE